jgi:hypothetical protein
MQGTGLSQAFDGIAVGVSGSEQTNGAPSKEPITALL